MKSLNRFKLPATVYDVLENVKIPKKQIRILPLMDIEALLLA